MILQNYNMVGVLGFLIVLDYVIGVILALDTHSLKSSIMRKGITEKLACIVLIMGFEFLNELNANVLPSGLIDSLTGFYILAELISILEHMNSKNLLPETVKKFLGSSQDNNIDKK